MRYDQIKSSNTLKRRAFSGERRNPAEQNGAPFDKWKRARTLRLNKIL